MAESRTRNVAINITASLLSQTMMLVLNFILRTVFIRTLNVDYLGVNGLFSNVLSILSFAELGIGNAIIFSLYKPLAIRDEEKLCSLMHLYKVVYRAIFFIVLSLGLLLIPFLKYLIKGEPHINDNLILIYLLYLADTSISYLYIYKQSIIQADQKGYVVTSILTASNVVKVSVQIVVLYLFHNFILFLLIQIICKIAGNIYCSHVANKRYPYINKQSRPLEKSESQRIFKDVKSMAAYKFGSIVLNSTDNIIISSMISITSAGVLSNYTLLSMACKNILGGITSSFTASIGNLNAVGTIEQKYNVFNKVLLITVWLYGMAAIGIMVVSKNLISVWIGQEFVLKPVIVFALICEFYVAGVHTVESHYRTTMGYFVKGRLAPIMAAVLNIVLSVLLCIKWGLLGVLAATSISRVLTLATIDSWIIFKDGFHRNPIIYFLKNFGYLSLLLFIGIICDCAVRRINIEGWLGVILQIVTVLLIYNLIMLFIFHRSQLFKEIFIAGKSLVKGRNK